MPAVQGIRLSPTSIQFITSGGSALVWPTEQFLDDNLSTYYTGDARFYNNMASNRAYFGSGTYFVDSYTGRVWVHGTGSGYVALEEGLNGHSADASKTVNLDAALVPEVASPYQVAVTAVKIRIKTVGPATVRLEVKDASDTILYTSGNLTIEYATETDHVFPLPTGLTTAKKVFFVCELPVDLDVYWWKLVVATPPAPYWQQPFCSAYSQMTRAFNPSSGLSRDQLAFNAGEFDAAPATGLQILAQAMAYDLGVTTLGQAQSIAVAAAAALVAMPKHSGTNLLPHFLLNGAQHPSSEWSTVDTALALLPGLIGCRALGLASQAIQLSGLIDALVLGPLVVGGLMRMGYAADGTTLLGASWDTYGGESVLADGLRLYQNPGLSPLNYTKIPPVYAGRGFIQELAAAILPRFGRVGTGSNEVAWRAARSSHAAAQKAFSAWRHYGKSSGEIIWPDRSYHYLAAGIGDGVQPAVDTDGGYGPYFFPHYPSLVADVDSTARATVQALVTDGCWQPVTGPVDSFAKTGDAVHLINYRQVSLNAFFHVAGWYWKWAAVDGKTLVADTIAGDARLSAMCDSLLAY